MLGKIRVAGSATGDDGWGPAYRAGRGLNTSRYATDYRKIFAAHAALSNRMVEDIARHICSSMPTLRTSNAHQGWLELDSEIDGSISRGARTVDRAWRSRGYFMTEGWRHRSVDSRS
jgi:hypothetical protein